MGTTGSAAKVAGTGTGKASAQGHIATGHTCNRCGNAADENGNRAARRLAAKKNKKKGVKAKPSVSDES